MATRITQDAIERARAEFTQRLCTNGRVGDRVVVAHDVTVDDLDQVPSKWLEGIVFSLQYGTLSIHQLTSNEQCGAGNEAALVICQYAKTHRSRGLRAKTLKEFDHYEFGRRTLDASLHQAAEEPPLVAVEVIVGTPSCVDMMNAARAYLSAESVERAVLFQIFPPESSASSELWEVPALAVVFGYEDSADRSSLIQILEIKSFGNVGIPQAVIDSLVVGFDTPESESAVPELEVLDQERGQQLLEPGLPRVIHTTSVLEDAEEIGTEAEPLELRVCMAEPLEDIVFDLVPIFTAAVTGRWWDLKAQKHRNDPPDSKIEMMYSVGCVKLGISEAEGDEE